MMTILRCARCESCYPHPDGVAGQRLTCRNCGALLEVPPRQQPVPVHEARHGPYRAAASGPSGPVEGAWASDPDDGHLETVSRHVECCIGPVHQVFRELVREPIPIDVLWVQPSSGRPFHTLVTSGMSHRAMNAPDDCRHLQYAELLITLPASWIISLQAFEQDQYDWPLRLLRMLARLPHEFETWLGPGHTVPNGDPPAPYSRGTRLCCALVMPARELPAEFDRLLTEDGRWIHFYSVLPLYRQETDLKLKKGLKALMQKLNQVHPYDVVDMVRPNSCPRNRWFGLF